jgi:hypothetical protein
MTARIASLLKWGGWRVLQPPECGVEVRMPYTTSSAKFLVFFVKGVR